MNPKFQFRAEVVEVRPTSDDRVVVSEDLRGGQYRPERGKTVIFDHVTVVDVDFSGSTFYHFVAIGSQFIGCDFGHTKFRNTTSLDLAAPVLFRDCIFDHADLRNWWSLRTSRFEDCRFEGTRIEGWQSWCAEFIGCTFACRITKSVFSGVPDNCPAAVDRSTNEFRENDFSRAEVPMPDFRQIDIRRQRWPTEPGYRIWDRWTERLRCARRTVQAWEPSRDRSNALTLIEAYLPDVLIESDRLTGPGDFGRFGPELRDRLIATLEGC